MKIAAYLVGLGVLAAGVSFGVSGLEAQQSTLLNFCPAKPGTTSCSAAATMLVSASNPSDDQLVAYITAIAGEQRSSRGCGDTQLGLTALVGAIDNAATRGLAQQVVDRLCGVTRTAAAGGGPGNGLDDKTLHDIVYGVDKGSSPVAGGSTGCSSSGSSGQTSSGASGSSSGTSGQTSSGASGSSGTSGTSGQTSGQTSSGASGSSGQTSCGSSGQTSSGGSSGTSGQSSGSSGQASSSGA